MAGELKMDVREKLVELLGRVQQMGVIYKENQMDERYPTIEQIRNTEVAARLIAYGVTVPQWISVSVRLPDTYDKDPNWSQTVLFRTAEGHIHSGYRNIGRSQASFYDDDWTQPYWLDESERLSFEEDEVTHWMPLPELPKGE